MIAPAWQGCRVGSGLQKRLREFAQARRIKGFIAEVLPSNGKMIRLTRAGGDLINRKTTKTGAGSKRRSSHPRPSSAWGGPIADQRVSQFRASVFRRRSDHSGSLKERPLFIRLPPPI